MRRSVHGSIGRGRPRSRTARLYARRPVALIAAVLWRVPGTGNSPQVQLNGEAPIEIVELAAEGDDFELMTEDPEFYSWVAQQAGNGSNGVG